MHVRQIALLSSLTTAEGKLFFFQTVHFHNFSLFISNHLLLPVVQIFVVADPC